MSVGMYSFGITQIVTDGEEEGVLVVIVRDAETV